MPTEMEHRNLLLSHNGGSSPPTSDEGEALEVTPMRKPRRRLTSRSFEAVKAALYQLTRLNDFQTEKIGAGFFADVYKVTHKGTGEVMVLKMNKNRKNSKQMLAEIQLMNRLSHSNILSFKGSCVHEGQLHALTEYINGGSLEDLIQNKGLSLSWSVRLKIAKDIAHGMAYLHSRGVFHRDLTSKNCLIHRESDGTIRTVVADFGLAAKIKHNKHKRRSYTEVVGSPYWMAPECLKGKEYCEQADVFSYGIILAEVISRIPADPDFMPRTQQFGVNFEELQSICPECPRILWDVMCQCCQLDPDDRPPFSKIVSMFEDVATEHSYPLLSSSASESALSCRAVPPSPSDSIDGVYRHSSVSSTDLEDQLTSLLEDQELSPTFLSHRTDFCGSRNSSRSMFVDGSVEVEYHDCCDALLTPIAGSAGLTMSTPPMCGWSSRHARQTSDASDISFTLPPPSVAWAPPPSPDHSPNSSPPLQGVSLTSFNGFSSSSSSNNSPTLTQKSSNISGPFGYQTNPQLTPVVCEQDKEVLDSTECTPHSVENGSPCSCRRLSHSFECLSISNHPVSDETKESCFGHADATCGQLKSCDHGGCVPTWSCDHDISKLSRPRLSNSSSSPNLALH